MANIAVKCPICGKIKVNRRKVEQTTFYCCGLAHNLQSNLVAEGQKRVRKKRVLGKKVVENIKNNDVLEKFLSEMEAKDEAI